MQWLVDHFYLFIVVLGTIHLCALLVLWGMRRRQVRGLSSYLHNLVKHFSTSTDHRPGGTLHEQIDSFIADVREVTHNPERHGDRTKLYYRILIKDESKNDLHGTKVETWYNFFRTGTEAYPLLGILGTILAIALGLANPAVPAAGAAGAPAAAVAPGATAGPAAPVSQANTGAIIRNFANSIWSTAAGIGFAVLLMMVNACIEPGFDRLLRQRQAVREVIAAAKIHLGLHVAGAPELAGTEGPSAALLESESQIAANKLGGTGAAKPTGRAP